jgi:hypothetical protein
MQAPRAARIEISRSEVDMAAVAAAAAKGAMNVAARAAAGADVPPGVRLTDSPPFHPSLVRAVTVYASSAALKSACDCATSPRPRN